MTVISTEYNYLENPSGYLEDPYLTGVILGAMGMQATLVIEDQSAVGQQSTMVITDHLTAVGMEGEGFIGSNPAYGMQALGSIVDHLTAEGQEAEGHINDYLSPMGQQVFATVTPTPPASGMQATLIINAQTAHGHQAEGHINDHLKPNGMQAFASVIDHLTAFGMSAKADKLSHTSCEKYLVEDYLTESYLAGCMEAHMGMQANGIVFEEHTIGMQATLIIEEQKPIGQQVEGHIIDHLTAFGMQAQSVQTFQMGMQAEVVIYNTTNLRMLCEFVSRGVSTTNWVASSTEPGDFGVENLDTDIQEQIWRSATGIVTSINLTNDTGVPQGVAVDTVFIGNHNLTSSAQVTLLGANNPGFSPVGITIPMQWTEDNMYYIAPEYPQDTFRYWRFVIDDVTNTDNFVSIGILLFGATDLFHGECFVDKLRFQHVDFVDKIPTEGFTNVGNSRALKKQLGLEFRSLKYQDRNFRIMRQHIIRYRTTHKCLWIPTPSADDQEITARYAVFGKMVTLPAEAHNSVDADHTYVDFTIDVDESL